MPEVLELWVGGQVWLEGAVYRVDEIDEASVLLSRAGEFRRVGLGAITARGQSMSEAEPAGGTVPLVEVLSSLSVKQRSALERELAVITRALSEENPAPSAVVAKDLGISERTAQRRLRRFEDLGPAGLVDRRSESSGRRSAIPPEWDEACRDVLARHRDASTPSIAFVSDRTNALVAQRDSEALIPSRTAAYRHLSAITAGTAAFGSAKRRRSDAARPQGVLGSLRADRPGQYVVLDSTPLDVFAAEPVTDRWVGVELTVAMDLYSRCITGLRLRPVSTRSREVAEVLYQTVTPQRWGAETTTEGPYVGVPEEVVFETGAVPDTIIVDHGRAYMSEHVEAVCARLGINVQPATPRKPTDKPTIERFFRTLRQDFLERLPASTSLAMEFLEVAWRKIHHYGVTIDSRRYDGPELNLYRGQRSDHGGLHAGKWPFYVDRNDVRAIHFQDPVTEQWSVIAWDRARDLNAPFSAEAADYVRQLQLGSPTEHVDHADAVNDLVERYSQGSVKMRRAEKNLARQVITGKDGSPVARDGQSGELIDLQEHLARRANAKVTDDMDVFEKYDTDDDRFEVFEE